MLLSGALWSSTDKITNKMREKIMSQFLKVKSAEEVLHIIKNFEPLPSESVALQMARARVLAAAVKAP